MKQLFISLLSLATALSAAASSLVLDLHAPGTLAQKVTNPADVTTLTLSGLIDVRDFDFIAENMPNLTSIDISDVTISSIDAHRRIMTGETHFPPNVIPAMAFAGMHLTSVALPTSAYAIGVGAFANTDITDITIPPSIGNIGNSAFASTKIKTLTIPSTVGYVGVGAFSDCQDLKSVTFQTTLIPDLCFQGDSNLKTVVMSDDVKLIGNSAFADCSSLSDITFSPKIQKIGNEAFRASGLQILDLGPNEDLREIGDWAFADMSRLKIAYLPETVTNMGDAVFFNDNLLNDYVSPLSVSSIGTAAFKGVANLNQYNLMGLSTERVNDYAFYGMASQTAVHLPPALASIGTQAFDGMSNLERMTAPSIAVVPTLGDDVWGELDRPSVTLEVPEKLVDDFAATPVWKDFNIVKYVGEPDPDPSDPSDPGGTTLTPSTIDSTNLIVRLEANSLHLSIYGDAALGLVEIYDVFGRRLFANDFGANTDAFIDLSRWPSVNLFLVRCLNSTAKIVR